MATNPYTAIGHSNKFPSTFVSSLFFYHTITNLPVNMQHVFIIFYIIHIKIKRKSLWSWPNVWERLLFIPDAPLDRILLQMKKLVLLQLNILFKHFYSCCYVKTYFVINWHDIILYFIIRIFELRLVILTRIK